MSELCAPLLAVSMSKRTHNDYQKLEKLGEGTFGVVHKAKHIETGEVVALKKMRLEDEEDGVPATALREIAILRELKHPNVIECAASPPRVCHRHPSATSAAARPRYDRHRILTDAVTNLRCPSPPLWLLAYVRRLQHVFHTEKSLYLAFEFCDSDLKQYMRSIGNKLLPAQVQSYCWQLLNGLTWCHSHRIFHRDLKPQNLLVQPARGVLKIGDFGLTRAFSLPLRSYTHEVVTLWYRAPEILLGAKEYACPIDMWSVGCVLGEMATGRPMFPGDSEIDEIFKIFQLLGARAPTWRHVLGSKPEPQPRPLAPLGTASLEPESRTFEPSPSPSPPSLRPPGSRHALRVGVGGGNEARRLADAIPLVAPAEPQADLSRARRRRRRAARGLAPVRPPREDHRQGRPRPRVF